MGWRERTHPRSVPPALKLKVGNLVEHPQEQVMGFSTSSLGGLLEVPHAKETCELWACLVLTPTQEGELPEFNDMLSEEHSLLTRTQSHPAADRDAIGMQSGWREEEGPSGLPIGSLRPTSWESDTE